MDKSGQQEMAETRSNNDGCSSRSWWRWTSTAADNDDGGGGRQQQRTTKVADDNNMQDWVADYKGEGGKWVANNKGIRQKADKPTMQIV